MHVTTPSLKSLMVSVDVKHHVYLLTACNSSLIVGAREEEEEEVNMVLNVHRNHEAY